MMVEYQGKRALIPIVKTERDIKVEFLKHFYDEISVYVLLSRVHVHNLHPGENLHPGAIYTRMQICTPYGAFIFQ